MRDFGGIQQGLDGGDQYGIIGADKLTQSMSPDAVVGGLLPRPARFARNKLGFPPAARDRVELLLTQSFPGADVRLDTLAASS